MELFRSQKFSEHHREGELEEWLKYNLDVLTDGEPLLLIGQQVSNPLSGKLDLLALDAEGNVVVIELKREKPPRDAVAQVLEYAAWVAGQSHEDILARADRYLYPNNLARRWNEIFSPVDPVPDDAPLTEEPAHIRLNERQRIFLVVEGYSERITAVAQYLRQQGVDFNLVTFHYYRIDSGDKMLDFELSVGPGQNSTIRTADTGQGIVSEEATLAGWLPAVQDAYQVFRDRLLDREKELIIIEPKPAAVTFRRQMPDKKKPVYLCSFEPDRGSGKRVTLGIKKPSLQDFLDIEAVARTLEDNLPDGATISNKSEWVTIWFDPVPELATRLADLIYHHIGEPLANR